MISSANYTALVFDKLVNLDEISGKNSIICLISIANIRDNSFTIFIFSLIKIKDRIFLKNEV